MNLSNLVEEEVDKVCKGKMCPVCKSMKIKVVGSHVDGRDINMAYDCEDCGEQWEGY